MPKVLKMLGTKPVSASLSWACLCRSSCYCMQPQGFYLHTLLLFMMHAVTMQWQGQQCATPCMTQYVWSLLFGRKGTWLVWGGSGKSGKMVCWRWNRGAKYLQTKPPAWNPICSAVITWQMTPCAYMQGVLLGPWVLHASRRKEKQAGRHNRFVQSVDASTGIRPNDQGAHVHLVDQMVVIKGGNRLCQEHFSVCNPLFMCQSNKVKCTSMPFSWMVLL